MEKVRYEIDPHNRLIISKTGEQSGLPEFRKVIDGQFKTDEFNDLSYNIKAPLSENEDIPHQVRLKGAWSLTDNYDLRLTLDKSGRDTFGDRITLQGEILDVNENSLLFAVTTTTKENTQLTYVLNLQGSWKADEFNRLSFHIRKEESRYDILTFNGVWEIDSNHQIIYQYEKAALIKKKKESHTLMFKGHWDIKDNVRLLYALSAGTDSVLSFRTSAGIFKENYIQYELGVESGTRADPAKKTITLFGGWSVKKDVGLLFEIEYKGEKPRAIVFGADARLTDKDTVSFRLKNDIENKDIGANLELSRKILKGDGEIFLRALKSKQELAMYAGAAWRW